MRGWCVCGCAVFMHGILGCETFGCQCQCFEFSAEVTEENEAYGHMG